MRRSLMIAAAAAMLGAGPYGGPPTPRDRPAPSPKQVGIIQRLGTAVPLSLPFKDESGNRVTLGRCVGGKPTVLVLAYYGCPMLCTEVLNGLLASLRALPGTIGDDFNVITVSFDPREKHPLAALKRAHYLERYGRPAAEPYWHFLTGDPLAIATLTEAVGFRYQYDQQTQQYAHGSGLIVLSPEGKITRYLLGVSFPPQDLRLALAEASAGKVGSPVDQVLLLCYRYDPATGRYTPAILRLVRLGALATMIGVSGLLAGLAWRERRRRDADVGQPLRELESREG